MRLEQFMHVLDQGFSLRSSEPEHLVVIEAPQGGYIELSTPTKARPRFNVPSRLLQSRTRTDGI